MNVTARRERNDQQRGGDLVLETGRRWFRVAVYFGTPPGSRIGFWRTKADAMRGVNLRIGRQYTGPCLTVFAHTRPARTRR